MTEMASWQKLQVLACSRNCIVEMDPSLTLLPQLQSLMVAHSNISSVASLQACTQLTRCYAFLYVRAGNVRNMLAR